jgi:hypothetical protein
MSELDIEILKCIEDYHNKTNGNCGLGVNDILQQLEIPFIDIKKSLNSLYKLKKIKVKKGINGNLIFKA